MSVELGSVKEQVVVICLRAMAERSCLVRGANRLAEVVRASSHSKRSEP